MRAHPPRRRRLHLALEPLESRRLLATITVNTTSDSDAVSQVLSMRQAIEIVNGTLLPSSLSPTEQGQIVGSLSSPATIDFDISGTGVHTIEPTTEWPIIYKPVTIDGYSQPGSHPNTLTVGDNAKILIQIEGQNNGSPNTALNLNGGYSVVDGLDINRCGSAILFYGSTGHDTFWGNFIGLDPTGMIAEADYGRGAVFEGGTDDTVGGTQPAARNLIQVGVQGSASDLGLECDSETNLYVLGNYIGVNATGTAVPSGQTTPQQTGVLFLNDTGATVGAAIPGAGNVITSVYIGTYPSGTLEVGDDRIRGNEIGVDVTGLHGLPTGNGAGGIGIYNSTGNVIGGTDPGDGNEIAILNGSAAVTLNTDNAASNLGTVLEGNFIGTNPAGTANFGEQIGVNISSSDNAIGELPAGAGNVIANNSSVGIEVSNATATGNTIVSNRLYNNGAGGITLEGASTTGTPKIAAAYPVATGLQIVGGEFRGGTPGVTYVVQFFDNVNGQTLIGTQTVAADARGDGSFAPLLPVGVLPGQTITATVTGGGGNTTLIPSPVTVSPQPTVTLSLAVSPGAPTIGQVETLTVHAAPSVTGLGSVSGSITFRDGATVLGVIPLDANGNAVLTTTLPVGNHVLTALYTGGTTFPGAISNTVASSVIAVPPTVLGVARGPAMSKKGGATVVVSFSAAMNATLASNPGFYQLQALKLNKSHQLVPSGKPIKIAVASYNAGTKQVVLTPSIKLNPKTLYRLTVTGLTDVYGTALAGGSFVGTV